MSKRFTFKKEAVPEPEPEETAVDDITAPLAPEVLKRTDELKNFQKEEEEAHKKYNEELRQLERKYDDLYLSIQNKRKDIILGTVEAVANTEGENAANVKVKGIPNFWLTAMKNSGILSGFIEEHDEPVLKYLENVTVTILPDYNGFQISFYFAENNPYFTNKVLTKTVYINGYIGDEESDKEKPTENTNTAYAEGTCTTDATTDDGAAKKNGAKKSTVADDDEDDDEEDEDDEEGDEDDNESFDGVQKIEGTEINWKPGKNVTVTYVLTKKGKGKNARTVREEQELPSFFRFFEPTDFHYDGGNDMQALMEHSDTIQQEISITYYFRDSFVRNAVGYFLGEIEDDEEEDDDDEGDYDDDEDDDDEGEDDEEEAAPVFRKSAKPVVATKQGAGKKDKDADDEEEDDEATAAALAAAFKRKLTTKNGVAPPEVPGKK